MSWLRTNWLDALIFLLVALVMAGVVFFLTGVNPFSRFQGGANTTQVSKPPTAKPAPQPPVQIKPEVKSEVKPGNSDTAKPVTPPKPLTTKEPVLTTNPVAQPAPPTSKPPAVAKPQTKPSVVQVNPKPTVKQLDSSPPRIEREPVVTLVPRPRAEPRPVVPKPVPVPVQVSPQAAPKPSKPVNTVAIRTPPPSPPASKPPVRVSRGDTAGNWQVSAGSFANVANAEALAGKLRAQGWKAQVVRVGNYNRVYVGPYNSSSRARAAASALGNGARAFSGGAFTATPQAAPNSAAKVTTKPLEIRIGTAAVYLQVGAYKSLQNAQPAINKLKAEGYPVQVLEGKFVRVRVGPVSNKAEVVAKLRRLGFSAFEVK